MLRLLSHIAAVALLAGLGCGSAETSKLENVPQGGGAELDISDVQQTGDLGKTVITRIDAMSVEAVEKSAENDTDSAALAAQQQFCTRGTFNKSVGPHLTMGGLGTATFLGLMTVEKLGTDGVTMQIVHEGKYAAFSFTDGKGKSFILTGSVTAETKANIWTGASAFCASPTATLTTPATIVRHLEGTFTLSGTHAAALTFNLQRQIALAGSSPTTETIEGTATIRSGTEERTCALALGEASTIVLNCQ